MKLTGDQILDVSEHFNFGKWYIEQLSGSLVPEQELSSMGVYLCPWCDDDAILDVDGKVLCNCELIT